jgi:hypothetical protein
VVVNPPTITLTKGSSYTFTAIAYQRDGAVSPQGVTWTVSPTTGGSYINSSGLLTIPAGETATTLTVRATSVATNTVSGTATVTVKSTGPQPYDIQRVEIFSHPTTVLPGKTVQFTARVLRYDGQEDYGGVTWLVSPVAGGSTINANGLLTVAAGETATSLTIRCTSKTDPTVFSLTVVTIIKDDGTGVPGLDDTPIGGVINIDGIDWIKVYDDRNTSTGVKWSLLLKKDNLPNPTLYVDNDKAYSWVDSVYYYSNVRTAINGWYANTNMPTLKKYALQPALYPTGPNHTWGYPAPTGPNDNVAFCPHKNDVFNRLTVSQLQNGGLWWTQTQVKSGTANGFLDVLKHDGQWSPTIWQMTNIYCRPAIFVKRG